MASSTDERLAWLRSPALPGTEVLLAENCTQAWRYFHERYAFLACATAAATVRYRNRDGRFIDHCAMAFEPGETHFNPQVAKPQGFRVLCVEASVLNEAARESGFRGPLHFAPAVSQDAGLERAIYAVAAACEAGQSELEQQTVFVECIQTIAKHAEEVCSPRVTNVKQAIARATAYLRERFDGNVTLDDLAAVSRLSRFHLVRAFRHETGLPPHAYLVHLRVERARRMLEAGVPAVEAALRAGFADQSHLARLFKRVMGVTPGIYAQANKGAAAPARLGRQP